MRSFLSVLVFWFFSVSSWAQSRVLTRTVTDPSNNPLSGVTVVAQPTGEGTSTNEAGEFTLTLSGQAKTLLISSVNFANGKLKK